MERAVFNRFRAALPEHLQHLVMMAYLIGWRRSELLSRKVSDYRGGILYLDARTLEKLRGAGVSC
jgi:hypothetical protein